MMDAMSNGGVEILPREIIRRPRKGEGSEGARRYRLEELIGSGGQAEVYRATDLNAVPHRPVAVKYLKYQLIDYTADDVPVAVKRFAREVDIALSMRNHPHLVRVLDTGLDQDGLWLYVMEYVSGGTTLAHLIEDRFEAYDKRGERRNPITRKIQTSLCPPSEILELFPQMLDAIGALHAKGILHRDLKPENILLTERNGKRHLLLSDYGIAKCFDPAAIEAFGGTYTKEGQSIGTPYYMSPEHFGDKIEAMPGGKRKEWKVCEQSDVWALGVIFFQLVTGQLPFDAEDLSSLKGRIESEHVPVPAFSEFVSNPDPRLETFTRLLLQKEPWKRPASVAEVKRLFAETVLEAPPPRAFSKQTLDQSSPPPRKEPVSAPVPARTFPMRNLAIAVLVAGAAGTAYWLTRQTSRVPAATPVVTPSSTASTSGSVVTSAAPVSIPAPVVSASSKKQAGTGPLPGSTDEAAYAAAVKRVKTGDCSAERNLWITRIRYPDFPDPLLHLATCSRIKNRPTEACERYTAYLSYEGVLPLDVLAGAFVRATCTKP